MIEIVIDDKVVEISPDLSIGQFQRLRGNLESYKKDPAQLLSLYLNIPLYQIKDLPVEQVKFVEEYLTQSLAVSEFKDETNFIIRHKGVEYGLENDWGKLAWGAWMDLEVYSAENIEQNIHKIMAILYRPIKEYKKDRYVLEPYKASEIEDRAEEFLNLPFKYWAGCSSFFLLIASQYMVNMQSSLNTMNRINKLTAMGWKILPKWVQRRLPIDSILISPTTSQMKTLQRWSK